MNPLQFGSLFSSGPLIIGGVTFVLIFIGIVAFFVLRSDWFSGEPWDNFIDAAHEIVDEEDADAIAFIPYSDGPLLPKPAMYDRELLGGKGGYVTPDGDRIYVDGQGNGKFDLEGVPVIMAIDPTEHAAAADPLKAYIAHEKNVGRWIKVDREGNLIEAGEALKAADPDAPTPAMDKDGQEHMAADGGYASAVHERAAEGNMSLEDALKELESENLVHKIVDVAPPREAVIDEDTGEVNVEQASHVAVDFSAAADMLPKKTNTTELQVAEEKAKNEARDDDKLRETFITGAAVGGLIGGGVGVVMALIFAFA
jgi:hypothetical protein